MTGEDLKRKLTGMGYTIAQLADMLEMSQQNLSRALGVADVKTGFLEKLSEVTGKNISFFYEGTKFLDNEKPQHANKNDEINNLKGQVAALKEALKLVMDKFDSIQKQIVNAG